MTTNLTTTIKSKTLLFLFISTSHLLFAIPAEFLNFEKHRLAGEIHQAATALSQLYGRCEQAESLSPENAGFCAIVRNEVLQSLTPAGQYDELKKIEPLKELFETGAISAEERLFIQMRFYAYLPRSYGQNFGKSLVALESLKRLKPGTPNLGFYEKEIRFLQGKQMEGEGLTWSEKESVLDRKRFGWFAGIQYLWRLGLLGKIGYQDDRLNDGPWGFDTFAFASTKPVFGAGGGVSFSQNDSMVNSNLRFSTGREDFYGLTGDASDASVVETKIQRVDLAATYSYWLNDELKISVGGKVKEIRTTEPSETVASLVGPYLAITLDALDQDLSPRWGHRVSMYGYFHRFQQFGLEARLAVPVSSSDCLNLGTSLEEQFGRVLPFTYLRLGETYYVPGIAAYRFQDRTVVNGWGEFRHELTPGLGGGLFASGGFVGDTFDDSFKHKTLVGYGAFVDWRWTRYPRSDSRIEISRFAEQTLIQVGITQGL